MVGLVAWIWLFGVFWYAFGGQGEGALVLAISTFFLIVVFGVPYIMKRTADKFLHRKNEVGPMADFLHGDVETLTGDVSGWGALIQVVVVPVSVALGMTAIAIIIATTRGF